MLADQVKAAHVSELVTQAKEGDHRAFDRLVELHAPAVYNLALRVTGSREEAEDCVQEAFLRAYAGLRGFRGEAAFSTWLYRVALNVAREAARKLGRNPLLATDLAGGAEAAPELEEIGGRDGPGAPSPEETMLAMQKRRLVLQAIGRLPQHHREVVVLFDLQGLSYEEIGRILRVRVGTVKSRLSRARLALKEALTGHLELLRE